MCWGSLRAALPGQDGDTVVLVALCGFCWSKDLGVSLLSLPYDPCMSPLPLTSETSACPPHLHPTALAHATFSWARSKMMAASLASLTQAHMLFSCPKPLRVSPSITAGSTNVFCKMPDSKSFTLRSKILNCGYYVNTRVTREKTNFHICFINEA